jgi:hypothetical protein
MFMRLLRAAACLAVLACSACSGDQNNGGYLGPINLNPTPNVSAQFGGGDIWGGGWGPAPNTHGPIWPR